MQRFGITALARVGSPATLVSQTGTRAFATGGLANLKKAAKKQGQSTTDFAIASMKKTNLGGTSSTKDVKVPGVPGRYATALFNVATAAGNTEKVAGELKTFNALINSNPSFSMFLNDASISRPAKKADIEAVTKKAGFSETTVNFFNLMGDNGRYGDAQKIIEGYSAMMDGLKDEIVATVTTAEALEPADKKKVMDALILGRVVPPNATVQLQTKVDASLLGGIVVEVGDRFVDLSVSSRIKSMKRVLEAAA